MAVILYIFCGKRYKVQVQVGTVVQGALTGTSIRVKVPNWISTYAEFSLNSLK